MIQITDKHNCCGCSACAQRCPKQCITMLEDNEGFLYPKVDEAICIGCELCAKACPVLNPYEKRVPIETIAAINNNDTIRMQSSSGGIFTMLAEQVIDDGGVVFGARFDEDWQVLLDYTETKDGIAAFRGSKYVQARIGETYKQCECFLKAGRKVLYSGTPCQISGLRHFLGKEYENLLTVDFACHGVPSPKVWRLYVCELQQSLDLRNVSMRNKDNGWRKFNFRVDYDQDSKSYELTLPASENEYMKAFLQDLILRPSCYKCKVKGFSSNSDMTIADYWGVWNVAPDMNDDKGTSLIFLHTTKARVFLPKDGIKVQNTDYEQAVAYNSAIMKSSTPSRYRDYFFSNIDDGDDLNYLIRKCTIPPFRSQVKSAIKHFFKMLSMGGVKIDSTQCLPNNYYTIKEISFRDKTNKWQKYNITIKIQ